MAAQANIKAVITADDRASRVLRGFGSNIDGVGKKVSNLGSGITRTVLPVFVALGAGLGAVSKMAFDQVSSVEQASLALRAYEKDGRKVDTILSDLLSYARSDMGVLFNRKDLFGAAQGLKIMGDSTSSLTDHVKIMSRSVGLGLSTWDDLTQIIGRVGSTGRLTGIDFDNLTKAGFKLDDGLRNTDITFEKLFKHLDKGIPVNALKGQANTIRGIGVRMQTALRGIGESILGVNKDTGKFIKGGAGDQLVKFFKDLPAILAKPEIQEGFKKIGQSLADFAKNALPKIIEFISFVGRNIDTITKLVGGVLAFGIAMKILGGIMTSVGTAIKFVGLVIKGIGIIMSMNPIGLIVMGIALAAFLIIKHWDTLKRWFGNFWNWLKQSASSVVNAVKGIFTGIFNFFKGVGSWLVNTGKSLISGYINGIKAQANAVWNAIKFVADKIGQFFKGAGSWLWNTGKAIIQGLVNGIKSAVGSVKDAIKGVISGAKNAAGSLIGKINPLKLLPGRAVGGAVSAGTPYMVGERRPEMFVPREGGRIVPQPKMGGSNQTINLNVNVGVYAGTEMEKRKLAESLMRAYQDLQQSRGMA